VETEGPRGVYEEILPVFRGDEIIERDCDGGITERLLLDCGESRVEIES